MSKLDKVDFGTQLLHYIKNNENGPAKSMILTRNLANASDDWRTLLHYAAAYDNATITCHLIKLGSAVDFLDRGGRTPLMLAVEGQCLATVEVLLEAGANVDIADYDGKTPLMIAVQEQYLAIVFILLDAGASIDIADRNGQSALQMTLHPRYDNSEIIRAFFNMVKTEVHTTEELVEKLFVAGCSLHHAVLFKDVGVLKGFLQRGLDANLRNYDGRTALQMAADANDFKMVKILIANGANVNALEKNCNGPLFYAARNKNLAMLKFLLKAGASPNPKFHKNGFWYTPMYALFADGSTDIVEPIDSCVAILLQHGAVVRDAITIRLILDRALKNPKSKSIDYVIPHLAMLEVLGYPTAESIVNLFNLYVYGDERDRSRIVQLEKNYKQYQQILKIAIFEKLSLIELLGSSENRMRIRVRNETFISRVRDSCSKHKLNELCPYYFDTLMRRISKTMRTVKLEDETISVICDIFHSNENECYVVARTIFSYLNERDLEQLSQV